MFLMLTNTSEQLNHDLNQLHLNVIRNIISIVYKVLKKVVKCFSCSDCGHLLNTWYFENNDRLYCKEHYLSRFLEACNHCRNQITGPVMVRFSYNICLS